MGQGVFSRNKQTGAFASGLIRICIFIQIRCYSHPSLFASVIVHICLGRLPDEVA